MKEVRWTLNYLWQQVIRLSHFWNCTIDSNLETVHTFNRLKCFIILLFFNCSVKEFQPITEHFIWKEQTSQIQAIVIRYALQFGDKDKRINSNLQLMDEIRLVIKADSCVWSICF